MTLMTTPLLGTDTRPYWRLSAIQVSNWGPYEGTHPAIPIDEDATLFVGKSGSGQSTLLDAYMLLLNDNDTALNEASNSGNPSSRRTPITYTRGQTGAEPADPSSYDLRDRTLRGHHPDTGKRIDAASGIAAVFKATDGQEMTIFRLFHVPAHARVMSDCTVRFGYAMRRIDLTEVMDFAEDKFQHLKNRVPGWVPAQGPGDIRAQAFRRFGVPASDPLPILDLMKKVQSSKPQASINELYQSMLEREPDTYRQANLVLKAHSDLRAIRAQMVDAEKQISRLEPIEVQHARMESAQATLHAADSLGVQAEGPSLFSAWLADRGLEMLDNIETHATATANLLRTRLKTAERATHEAEEFERHAHVAYLNSGGNQIQLLERDYDNARHRLERVQSTCHALTNTFAVISTPLPTNSADLEAVQETAQKFLASYSTQTRVIDSQAHEASQRLGALERALKEAQDSLKAVETTRSNIPSDYLKAREAYIQTSGISTERMPFIGQLIDVREGHEEWRVAINAVLGGWAKGLVIAPSGRAHLQRTLDTVHTRVRLTRHEATTTPFTDDADPRTLAWRIVVDEASPFAGWIRAQINKIANHHCVKDGSELGDGSIPRVTLSGQVSLRRRDIHGGNRNSNVIGLCTEEQIEQLRTKTQELHHQWMLAEETVKVKFAAKEKLSFSRAAYENICDLVWTELDLESAQHVQASTKAALDAAHNPESLIGQSRQAYEDATRVRNQALELAADLRTQSKAADKVVAKLITLKESEYALRDPELLAQLSDDQKTFLEERLARTVTVEVETLDYKAAAEDWRRTKEELRRSLEQELRSAQEAYSAATEAVRSVMESYDSDWPDKTQERLPEPENEYSTYLDILNQLRHNDLPSARNRWEKRISDDATRGLGLLRRSYSDYIATVRETLANLNQVLMGIEFRDGTKRIRLDVHDRTRANAAMTDFLTELAGLTEQAARINPNQDLRPQREALFIALDKALSRIDQESSERDLLLNVNRHLIFRATVVDANDITVEHDVIDALTGTHSGGESQQISAIITGAALRYRMNDGGEAPRFMPIILDEAFIKADADFTEQGINAWRALGFQLIVGAPEEKTESLMRTIPAMRVVTKDNELHTSHVFNVDRATGTVNAG